MQFEVALALTNIFSGTSKNTKVVIDYGALLIFVELLTSGNDNVREQATCLFSRHKIILPNYLYMSVILEFDFKN